MVALGGHFNRGFCRRLLSRKKVARSVGQPFKLIAFLHALGSPRRKEGFVNDNHQLLSLNDAVRLTSLSRSMLNRYRSEGRFPKAVSLGEKRIAFVAAEVRAWIADRIAARAA